MKNTWKIAMILALTLCLIAAFVACGSNDEDGYVYVTDSDGEIRYDEENKPGVSNLINIYGALKGLSTEQVEKTFEGLRYGDFKMAVGEACVETLTPIRLKYEELMADKAYLNEIFKKNALRAGAYATETLEDVYKKVGFVL